MRKILFALQRAHNPLPAGVRDVEVHGTEMYDARAAWFHKSYLVQDYCACVLDGCYFRVPRFFYAIIYLNTKGIDRGAGCS